MVELHDAIGPMGNLTSYNVLVDRRWTCRISDYGLDRFKEPNPIFLPTLTEDETYRSELILHFERTFSFAFPTFSTATFLHEIKAKHDKTRMKFMLKSLKNVVFPIDKTHFT